MASLIQTQLEANALLRQHGLAERGWTFKWDTAKRRGGACHYRTKDISMSKYLVAMWPESEVTETLLHEVAHALAGSAAGHGRAWQIIARSIGSTGARTHNNEVVQGRYVAICDYCGVEAHRAHRMSPAMKQGRHLHAKCRKPVRWVDTGTLVR